VRTLVLSAALSVALCSAIVACGSADEPPLGGPYGGSAPVVAPSGGGDSTGTGSGTGAVGSSNSPGGQESAVDAGASTPAPSDASMPTGTPTWSQIFAADFAPGTAGSCSACHSAMATASGAYAWLSQKNQLGGASPKLVSASVSCLSWMGGNMPPGGPSSNPMAAAALEAWAAAGAQDN